MGKKHKLTKIGSIELPGEITLIIDPSVMAEMMYLSRECNMELGGVLGMVGVEENVLYCNKILTLKGDHHSRAHFSISESELAKTMLDLMTVGQGFIVNGWWHSHAGLSAFMSSEDSDTSETLLKYSDVVLAIVVNSSGEIYYNIDTVLGSIPRSSINLKVGKVALKE